MSSMGIVYSILSGLIFEEFLKAASPALHNNPSLSTTVIVLLSSIWIFYVVFDTLVWLNYSDKNRPSGAYLWQLESKARKENLCWLACRSIEFTLFIWLYDYVEIVKSITDTKINYNPIAGLGRFAFDSGVICFGWFLWHLFWIATFSFKNKPVNEKYEYKWSMFRLFSFSLIFVVSWYGLSNDWLKGILSIEPVLAAHLFVCVLVILQILLNYFTRPIYCKNVIRYFTG